MSRRWVGNRVQTRVRRLELASYGDRLWRGPSPWRSSWLSGFSILAAKANSYTGNSSRAVSEVLFLREG